MSHPTKFSLFTRNCNISVSDCLNYFTLSTGALGITVANPTDLVKVRLQAEGKLPAGVPRRYTGALNAYSTIVRQVMHVTNEEKQLKRLLNAYSLLLKFFATLRKELRLSGLVLDQMLLEMLS